MSRVNSKMTEDEQVKAVGLRVRLVDRNWVHMERRVGTAHQRFADYCHERGVDEDEAVIAMTVACHIDDLHILEKRGYSAVSITKEPSHIMQTAGVFSVGIGSKPSWVDWNKVKYYLKICDKLRS